MLIYLVFMSFLVTLLLLFLSIKYPLTLSKPTKRGLHNQSKPSSGGMAILGAYISISLFAYFSHHNIISISSPIVLLSLISILGLLDDKYQLSKTLRFIAQGVISLLIITSVELSILESIIWTFFFLFFINIYNFMDGIDGLAISQAIYISIAFMILDNFYSLNELLLFTIPLIVFLFFNISPSKIFLGNSGSYLLGMFLLILIFNSFGKNETFYMQNHAITIFILFTVFFTDSVYTIIMRFLNKIRETMNIKESLIYITNPHRSHNYQQLAKQFNNHNKVNFLLMAYNFLWCLPLAYLNQIYLDFSFLFILLSYLPYTYICYFNKSGTED